MLICACFMKKALNFEICVKKALNWWIMAGILFDMKEIMFGDMCFYIFVVIFNFGGFTTKFSARK